MGVWVVLSGGQGDCGGRIYLCQREHGPVIKAIYHWLNILPLIGSVVNYPTLSRWGVKGSLFSRSVHRQAHTDTHTHRNTCLNTSDDSRHFHKSGGRTKHLYDHRLEKMFSFLQQHNMKRNSPERNTIFLMLVHSSVDIWQIERFLLPAATMYLHCFCHETLPLCLLMAQQDLGGTYSRWN